MINLKRFTLLELIVVVAVIAILVSILLPSLVRAREKSRNAVCLSNVGQINTATDMYGSDNNNRYPFFERTSSHEEGRTWCGKKGTKLPEYRFEVTERPLNVYLGLRKDGMETPVTLCPSTPRGDALDNYLKKGTTYFGNSYGSQWPSHLEGKFFAQINNSNKVVIISADGAYAKAQDVALKWQRPFHVYGNYRYPYAFADGSAKFYSVLTKEGNAFENGKIIFNLNLD